MSDLNILCFFTLAAFWADTGRRGGERGGGRGEEEARRRRAVAGQEGAEAGT